MNKNLIPYILLILLIILLLVSFGNFNYKELFNNYSTHRDFYISIVCTKNYQKSLDILLDSIPSHFNKIIIYQNEPELSHYKINNDIYVNIPNNIFEYGHWIGINYLFNSNIINDNSIILLLHSTSKFIEDPTQKINNIIDNFNKNNYNIYFIALKGNCNICLVDKLAIDTGYNHYKDLMTLDKQIAINWEWDSKLPESPKNWNIKKSFGNKDVIELGIKPVYSDVKRKVILFEDINLEKYYATDNIKNAYNQ